MESSLTLIEKNLTELQGQEEIARVKIQEWQDNMEFLEEKGSDYEERLEAIRVNMK